MDTVKFGILLKELRKEHGMTQEQLAEKLGVTNRTVSRWEVGSNMPDLDIIIDLSELYQIEIKDLLNGEKKNTKINKEKTEEARYIAEYDAKQKYNLMRRIYFIVATGVVAIGFLFYTTLKVFDNVTNGTLVTLLLYVAFMFYNIVMQIFQENRSIIGYQFTLISGFIAIILSNILVLLLFFITGSYHNFGIRGLYSVMAIVISVFVVAGIISVGSSLSLTISTPSNTA